MKKIFERHQDYDKLLRSNLQKGVLALLLKQYGLKLGKITPIDTSLPRTQERRIDVGLLAEQANAADNFVVQMEFQTQNDPLMQYRMLGYYEVLCHKYHLPIQQYVVYLGNSRPSMATTIRHPNLKFRYNLIYLKAVDANIFIQGDTPEEIILGILGDFKKRPATEVIAEILDRLVKMAKGERYLAKYMLQLEILSNLRKLQPIVLQQLSTMPITYDITTDLRYQQGEKAGSDKMRAHMEAKLAAEKKKAAAEKKEAEAKLIAEKKEAEAKLSAEKKSTVKALLGLGILSHQQIARTMQLKLAEVKRIAAELK